MMRCPDLSPIGVHIANWDAAPVNCALRTLSFETEHVSVIVFDAPARYATRGLLFSPLRA
jgi:hypothetical protein